MLLESIAREDVFHFLRGSLDILTLSVIFYVIYRLFRVVKIPLLLNQIALLFVVYVVATLFELEAVLWIIKSVSSWLVIAMIVIFHPELRALVTRADYAQLFRRDKSKLSIVPDLKKITEVVNYLVKNKRGALFVFPRHIDLESIITSKIEINADLNVELLETIFGYDTVLHDGAVIIHQNRITYAGCFLPTERGGRVLYNLGSRHRAAHGLSQNSDAVVLVVSEEYGSVSLVFDGEILYDIGISQACVYIEQLLQEKTININDVYNNLDDKVQDSVSQ